MWTAWRLGLELEVLQIAVQWTTTPKRAVRIRWRQKQSSSWAWSVNDVAHISHPRSTRQCRQIRKLHLTPGPLLHHLISAHKKVVFFYPKRDTPKPAIPFWMWHITKLHIIQLVYRESKAKARIIRHATYMLLSQAPRVKHIWTGWTYVPTSVPKMKDTLQSKMHLSIFNSFIDMRYLPSQITEQEEADIRTKGTGCISFFQNSSLLF